MKQKKFKHKKNAKKFVEKLKMQGQLDIQIWELPAANNKSIYIVLWNPKYDN